MAAYYNEHDPFAAAWLRELIRAGHIAPGEVDERSIEDVLPSELRGFTQCHFFAGIGVWSYALRQAGWPDDREVWTGSCPCQPFSAAGKRGGVADERHLWPAFYHLIRECSPRVVFGEQVASKDGLAWFSTVSADLEAAGYAIGGVDLCAAGFGAPHIRQRLYFVGSRDSSILEHPASEQMGLPRQPRLGRAAGVALGDTRSERFPQRISDGQIQREALGSSEREAAECPGLTNRFWRSAEWIPCRDGKYRPIEPGVAPLATGITNRVGKLRGYGNALCAPVAQGFIEAYLETEKE